jgi:hypothetical protein
MYIVCVVRQSSIIAAYGPWANKDTAREFCDCYLNHESNVQIVPNYGTITNE